MLYKELIKDIKKKDFRPIYFLHGEESFFIDKIADALEKNVLTESEKSFNMTVLYGKDTDFMSVVDNARRYPMMSQYQLVMLKEAQDMKTLDQLATYIEKPLKTTVLVICYKHKKLDMRTKFAKLVSQKAFVFESNKLYDNQIADWIVAYLKEEKLSIEMSAAELIAEYLGTDLSKIANELEKLSLNIPKGTTINAKHIEENVGISKDYNVFELQKALAVKDTLKVQKIVYYFIANPRKNPLVVVIGTLYGFFSKVYMLHYLKDRSEKEQITALQLRSEWALREYKTALRAFSLDKAIEVINILKEYDLKSKGVNADGVEEGELLKEMTWKIVH